ARSCQAARTGAGDRASAQQARAAAGCQLPHAADGLADPARNPEGLPEARTPDQGVRDRPGPVPGTAPGPCAALEEGGPGTNRSRAGVGSGYRAPGTEDGQPEMGAPARTVAGQQAPGIDPD